MRRFVYTPRLTLLVEVGTDVIKVDRTSVFSLKRRENSGNTIKLRTVGTVLYTNEKIS